MSLAETAANTPGEVATWKRGGRGVAPFASRGSTRQVYDPRSVTRTPPKVEESYARGHEPAVFSTRRWRRSARRCFLGRPHRLDLAGGGAGPSPRSAASPRPGPFNLHGRYLALAGADGASAIAARRAAEASWNRTRVALAAGEPCAAVVAGSRAVGGSAASTPGSTTGSSRTGPWRPTGV